MKKDDYLYRQLANFKKLTDRLDRADKVKDIEKLGDKMHGIINKMIRHKMVSPKVSEEIINLGQ